jgi:hypothetical protein
MPNRFGFQRIRRVNNITEFLGHVSVGPINVEIDAKGIGIARKRPNEKSSGRGQAVAQGT